MLPEAIIDLQDNRLGSVPSDLNGAHVTVGISSLGTPNTLYRCSSLEDVKTKLGVGPLAESVATKVSKGIRPVYAVPMTVATQGTAGTVTATGPNGGTAGTATLAVTGNSKNAYDVILEITRDGLNLAANTAAFRVSFDGGDTFTDETAVPVSGAYSGAAVETGLTLTFTNGATGTSFVKGTQYKFASSAPLADSTGLAAALDAVLNTGGLDVEGVHVAASLSGAQAAVLAAKNDLARSKYRFWWGVGETRTKTTAETLDQWVTAVLADYANTFNRYCSVISGDAEVLSQLTARIDRRNPASQMLAWSLQSAVSQSPGEVARGTVPDVLKLYHDEFSLEGLSARFWTMRTFDAQGGLYITDGKTLAPANSDYSYFEGVRTINKVARAGRAVAIRYVNSRFRVTSAGLLDPRDTEGLIAQFGTPLDQMVAEGDLSSYKVVIDPNQNILSTKIIYVDIDCVPVGIARVIRVRLGYLNPRLVSQQVAQAAAPQVTA